MTERAQEEYRALRATIRERGTARVWVFVAGMAAWGALTVATATLASTPLAVLLPLLVLTAAFEAVVSLHVGVERIGRYIQVFYEEDEDPVLSTREDNGPSVSGAGVPPSPGFGEPGRSSVQSRTSGGRGPRAGKKWEHAAMAFGRPVGAIATDALFSIPFVLAALCNIGAALIIEPMRAAELIVVAGAHVLFILRVVAARTGAAQQRAIDLERFRQLKQSR
jgi:hypothetical protein